MESVQFTLRQSLGRALWSGLCLATLLATLLTGVFIVLGVCFVIGGELPAARLPAMPFVVGYFFSFAWCFASVVSFPLSLFLAIRGRRRKIHVEAGQLVVEVGRSRVDLDLKDCTWTIADLACDKYGVYFPRQRLVVAGRRKEWYACGFTDEKREEWERFLTNAGVRRRPAGWRRMLPVVLLSGVAGGTVGVCVGQIAALFGTPRMMVGVTAFLGFLDGAVAALMYYALINRTVGRMGRGGGIGLMTVAYAGLGLKMAMDAGGTGLAIVPLCNAAVGGIVGWYVYDSAARQAKQPPS